MLQQLIPKLSHPLTKSIRTLEGVLVIVTNIALMVIPIVSHALTGSQAVKYGTVLNVVYVASRSVVKGLAVLKVADLTPLPLISPHAQQQVSHVAEQVVTDIATVAARPRVLTLADPPLESSIKASQNVAQSTLAQV